MPIAKPLLVAVLALLVLPAHYPQDLLVLEDCYELWDCAHEVEQLSDSCCLQLLVAPLPLKISNAKNPRVALSTAIEELERVPADRSDMALDQFRLNGQLPVPTSDLPILI
jgi:hypothetical protein